MDEGKIGGWVMRLLVFAMLCMTSASSHESLFEQGPEQSIRQGTVQEAQELMKQVDKLHWEGKYRAAILLAERAIEIRERLLGPEHPETATSINKLGHVVRLAGDYPRAERLIKRGLAIREEVFGAEDPITAESLNNLGALYHLANDFTQAELLYRRALVIREKALGPEHPDTLTSVHNLGLLYKWTSDFARAEPLLKRALETRERIFGQKNPSTAEALLNLGDFYSRVELFERAEPLLKRALDIHEKILGSDHPRTAASLRALARYYCTIGRFNEAESLYRRSIDIYKKVLGLEHATTAGVMNSLGLLYTRTGAYTSAESLFLQVIDIDKKVLGENTLSTSYALANLAQLYTRMGAYDRAEPLHRRSFAIRKQLFGPGNLEVASNLFDLAEFDVAVGNYTEAESLHRQALATKEKVLGPQHSFVANSLQDLANLYVRTGDARAESFLYRALAVREKSQGPEHPDTASVLSTLATFEWGHQKSDLALRLFQRAQSIQANNSAKFLLSGSEVRKRAYLQTLEKDTYRHVSFSVAVSGTESAVLGLTSVLQYKGRVLDAMSDSVTHLRQQARLEDQALLERRARIANRISILTYQAADQVSTHDYQRQADVLRIEQEKVERELAERSSEFRRQISPVTVALVQRAIPGDAALIEWFRYVPVDPKNPDRKARQSNLVDSARYVAYVLKRNAGPVVIDVGDAATVESLVRDFRLAVSDSKQVKVKERAAAFSKILLTPLYDHLRDVGHLLISPDGALNLMPMAALVDDQGEYLAQRFAYFTPSRSPISRDAGRSFHTMSVGDFTACRSLSLTKLA